MKSTSLHPETKETFIFSRQWTNRAASCVLAAQLAFVPVLTSATEPENEKAPAGATATAPDPVLAVMQAELKRAKTDLAKSDPAPYFLSYTVNDQDAIVIAGSYGGLLTDSAMKRRSADVVMRVGTAELDNTHGQSRSSGITSGSLPLDDDADATARLLWELTDRGYKRAAPAFTNLRTSTAVRAEEEDKSPDFSKER